MSAETAVQIAFAVGVVLVATTIAVALSGRGSRRELGAIAGLLGLAATGGWIVFALDVDGGTAVAAGGLTVCCAAEIGRASCRERVYSWAVGPPLKKTTVQFEENSRNRIATPIRRQQ